MMVMDMCGFNKMSEEVRKFVETASSRGPSHCAESALADMDKGGLSYRTILQVQKVLRERAEQHTTTISEDERLLGELSANLTSLVNAGDAVLAKTPGGAALRALNAVRYRYFMKKHLRDLCALFGAESCSVGGTGSDSEKSERCSRPDDIGEDQAGGEGDDDEEEEDEAEEGKVSLADEWRKHNRDDDNVLKRKLKRFNRWFNSLIHSPAVNHIKADLIPGFRVGTVATKNLTKEELYLAVPREAIIDTQKADRDYQFGKLLFDLERKYSRRDEFHELLLYLVYQSFVLGSESPYWPYLRLLPSPAELDRPLMWTREQVEARLGPSFIKESIMR